MRATLTTAALVLATASADSSTPTAVPCFSDKNHSSCPYTFGMNQTGCCTLADPGAVCCYTSLVNPTGPIAPGEGMKRSYCCPSGTQCSERGCTPQPSPSGFGYPCGPVQGQNCNTSYLCSSGPLDWTQGAGAGLPAVMVVGDSVSDGWTPVLEALLENRSSVVHSPGELQDGGARSTSNLNQCFDYLFSTANLKPLPLTSSDTILINFGLHDYNLGDDGVDEYRQEYTLGLERAKKIADSTKTRLIVLGTTPAHNVGTTLSEQQATDATVRKLNVAAASIAQSLGLQFVDMHSPLIDICGPVPWADNGTDACELCAPDCKRLSVHYTPAGYQRIAGIIANATGLQPNALGQ